MDIREVIESIIEGGRTETRPALEVANNSEYYTLSRRLLRNRPPADPEDRKLFLKGFLLLENSIAYIGSTAHLRFFLERFDGYKDEELMDWILSHRNNEWTPYSSTVPFSVKTMQQCREYWRASNAYDAERRLFFEEQARQGKERREKNRTEHAERNAATLARREAELTRLAGFTGIERVNAITDSVLPLTAIPAEYIPEVRQHLGNLSATALRKFWEKAQRIGRKSLWRVLRAD